MRRRGRPPHETARCQNAGVFTNSAENGSSPAREWLIDFRKMSNRATRAGVKRPCVERGSEKVPSVDESRAS